MTIASLLSDDPIEAYLEVALINAERRKFCAMQVFARYSELEATARKELAIYRQTHPKTKKRVRA